jgi:phage terminase large subunit-like protein
MPDRAAKPSPLPDDFKNWKPDAQARALELLRAREGQDWKPFYCPNPHCDGDPHDSWDFQHARADQRPPRWVDDWLVWLLSSGRGSGKTRTGAEVTHRATKFVPRMILIAPTGPDFRETMVEGESGILATSSPGNKPEWEPSKKKLTWPNGCIGLGFSAEEPDRLRGPQSAYIWADEPAHYPDTKKVWDNMLFGHRLKPTNGTEPKVVMTTTPKPTQFMRWLLGKIDVRDWERPPPTIVTRVSSYANIKNLADSYRKRVLEPYKGTRQGRQELEGELLEDVEGALWNWDMFQWIEEAPDLRRIVVPVDPAGTANPKSDETGIIAVGIGFDNNIYVLEDHTDKYSPEGWGTKANTVYERLSADAIVPEKNYGQDMVTFVLENAGYKDARIVGVNSRRGKAIRAEPVVALYEKRRVFHVGVRGSLSKLENEQTTWVPGQGPSPNRVDALVHGITEIAKDIMPVQMSNPNILLRGQQSPSNRPLRAV